MGRKEQSRLESFAVGERIRVVIVARGKSGEGSGRSGFIRAGGCGLGGVLTPTGIGTVVADGKRQIEIDGKSFLLELPLKADFALIAAHRADHIGNLEYALTSRNFNPIMAMAAATVIAEASEIVPVGVIPPDDVVTPAVLVDHLLEREKLNGR